MIKAEYKIRITILADEEDVITTDVRTLHLKNMIIKYLMLKVL